MAGLKRGPWTPEEDKKLIACIQQHGCGSWRTLPQKAGLKRCGKSCRLRWINYLRPDIKRGKFSLQEDQTIIQLHALLGNRWSAIAAHLPKRTDNEIKNYWNTHLKKRLAMKGIDPLTHKPKTTTLGWANGDPKTTSNLSHMAQWESARVEAEARLVRESKMRQHEPSSSGSKPGSTEQQNKMATKVLAQLPYLDILKVWQSVLSKSKVNGGGGGVFGLGVGGGCEIQSPTSTLCFSENAAPAMSTTGLFEFNHNMVFDAGEGWNIESSNARDGNFTNGNTNVLLSDPDKQNQNLLTGNVDANGSGIVSEVYEDNKKYWDDMLSLLNCGLLDSAVF